MLHVPNRRTYTDDQLRAAVTSSTTWSSVMIALGKKSGSGTQAVKAVAGKLGLSTSHFAYARNFKPVEGVEVPFSRAVKGGGQSGLNIAARWFLDRGYLVSVPLEQAPYDLVTESDDGLKRVQVKTTRQLQSNGRYAVSVARSVYDRTIRPNANGARKRVPYCGEEVDFLFIITPASSYLIPIAILCDRTSIVLDEKYAAFAV
jgi:hypothetical protein